MWISGVYILLGLPNSTSVSQEIDQFYHTYKVRCRSKTLSLFSSKSVERSKNIAKYKDELKSIQYVPIEPQVKITDTMSPAVRQAVINLSIAIKKPTLGNEDLGYIVNGCEVEKLHDCPFDFTFTQERILNANACVGCVPFTRACIKYKNVSHNFNQEDINTDIERINEEYQDAKKKSKDEGFRMEGLFDVEIATSTSVKLKEREEDQMAELLKRMDVFSA